MLQWAYTEEQVLFKLTCLSSWTHLVLTVSIVPSSYVILSKVLLCPLPFYFKRIGTSTSASVLPMNIQSWLPLGLTGLISLLPKGLSGVFSSTTVRRLSLQPSSDNQGYGKIIALTIQTFVSRVMSLLFNTLSRFVKDFLPRSDHHLISWVQSPSTEILESKKRSVTVSTFSPSIWHEVMGPDAMILVFLIFSFKQLFHSSPSPS